MRAKVAYHQLQKRAHRHRRASRAAAKDRDAAQAARVDDQAMLIGVREQLDAAHAEAFTSTHQRILANNRVALAEATHDRVKAKATQQAHVEWDLWHQLAHAQNMVVDLQHEVHYLNNQLHLILGEEEEDPEMFVEDDGWEEEVDLEDEDDDISDLDSEHAKE